MTECHEDECRWTQDLKVNAEKWRWMQVYKMNGKTSGKCNSKISMKMNATLR